MDVGRPTVLVIDDDPSVRAALASLILSADLAVLTFATADEFLTRALPATPRCLVLDVRLPGISGLELQARLGGLGREMPIVFITGYGDVPTSVRAMKAGAVEFLMKPVQDEELLEAIRRALAQDVAGRRERAELEVLGQRHSSLTPRERQVMELVVSGMPNKQIAAALGIQEITVKIHRQKVMEKMRAGSLAELVRLAGRLGEGRDPR